LFAASGADVVGLKQDYNTGDNLPPRYGALAGMWLITYDDGHGRPVMIRRVATKREAFDQACVLRRWYYLLSIEGPEGQRHDAEAITE
jgi:hypothetical protein